MGEETLSQLLKEHQLRQSKLKLTNGNSYQFPSLSLDLSLLAQLRKDAKLAIKESSEHLSEKLNERVSDILKKQKNLDYKEITQVLQQANLLQKQASQWSTMINQFNDALKELGDVQHWSKVIEREMEQVAGVLEKIEEERL
ncbi:hypothetical protein K502DRAFT_342072 [Neoconidiobolus thromboides FSU 785]|nr:hypothetical protein K502DRAFT_342072 [Neoconidiobolus thromboides FSU 785]